MAKATSREHRIYLALWRKAVKSPEQSVVIKASRFNTAMSMRQGMYRAIKPYREGVFSDTELAEAADKFVVVMKKQADVNAVHELVLVPRTNLAELEASLEDFGLDEMDLLVGDERLASKALTEFIQRDDGEPLAMAKVLSRAVSTPFYSREE